MKHEALSPALLTPIMVRSLTLPHVLLCGPSHAAPTTHLPTSTPTNPLTYLNNLISTHLPQSLPFYQNTYLSAHLPTYLNTYRPTSAPTHPTTYLRHHQPTSTSTHVPPILSSTHAPPYLNIYPLTSTLSKSPCLQLHNYPYIFFVLFYLTDEKLFLDNFCSDPRTWLGVSTRQGIST